MALSPVQVAQLRCLSLVNPLGIDDPQPELRWQLLADDAAVAGQSAYQIQVATSAALLAADTPDAWDSGWVQSAQSVGVLYAGHPLKSATRYSWRVRVWDSQGNVSQFSPPAFWETGLLHADDWIAQWIARPDYCINDWRAKVQPAPLLRKQLALDDDIASARVYLSGLGYSELSINGRRVGDHVLDPVVCQYDKSVPYVVHDVTEDLLRGENAIGVILGNGWYNPHTAEVWHFDKAPWRDQPKLLLQLHVTLKDGRTIRVGSDASWKIGDGAIRFDGLRNGETYDAQQEATGWDLPGFNDSAWKNAALVQGPGGLLRCQVNNPCKVTQTLPAQSAWEVRPGVWVFDIGQNMAGWARLTAQAPAGTQVTLKYSELLNEQRDIDPKHIGMFVLAGEFQTDHYTFKGGSTETFEPKFTYHGFRYVQVSGLPAPKAEQLSGRVVHSDFETIGSFECSNELLNKLQQATLWSYRGNFVGIPTDCPHREKNGWMGDAQLAAETGLMNFDADAAYRHWVDMMADVQRRDGQLPGIVPTGGWGFNWGNGPAWDSALLQIPWYLWLYRGDTCAIRHHYDAMKRYVDYVARRSPEGIARFGLGDWCPVDWKRMTPMELTSTGYFHVDALLLSRFAELLGRSHDHEKYHALADRIAAAARQVFQLPQGNWATGEQTALGTAVYHQLAETKDYPALTRRLAQAIAANDGKLDFGILGAKYVPRVLAESGEMDTAYRLLTDTRYPSWGHWITRGATTLWESWDGNASQNHIMYGDISAWMYHYLAGIRPDPAHPGFTRFHLHPHFAGDLQWVKARHHAPQGWIVSHWHKDGEHWTWECQVPLNTTATAVLPAKPGQTLRETIQLSPGSHRFTGG